MQYPNLLKRFIPFALTLALGLFIASFFVTLSPTFRIRGRQNSWRNQSEINRLRMENESLKMENDQLKIKKWSKVEAEKIPYFDEVPAVPPMPVKPIKPKGKKNSDGVGNGLDYSYEYRSDR
jgi:hypothetical protein